MKRGLLRSLADPTSAAEWFVRLDGAPPDEVTNARFAAWLDHAAEHDAELRRCDAAAGLVRALADDRELRWAYEEAAALATRRAGVPRARRRVLAWGVAAALAVASAALLLVFNDSPSSRARPRGPIAADIVANPALGAAAVVLAGQVVVDAQSVAVLPFTAGAATGDEPVSVGSQTLAAGLQQQLVAELAGVPGLYVVNEASVRPYASSDLTAAEIGAQLGARGVLRAAAALEGGRVHVGVELVDAATGHLLWNASYERPVDELRGIQQEVVAQVVAALVVPATMSVAVARSDTSNAVASVPLQPGAFE